MNSSIFVPKTINVGYQNRSGTYTGKLAYVIYYDEKGKLRKEISWNGWRDDKIPNDEFDNVPTEGFIGCNSYVKSASNCYSKNLREKCRTYIEIKTYPSTFDCEHWRNCIGYYHNLSAQGWIDLYERLIKEGYISEEMLEFCEPYLSRKGE